MSITWREPGGATLDAGVIVNLRAKAAKAPRWVHHGIGAKAGLVAAAL